MLSAPDAAGGGSPGGGAGTADAGDDGGDGGEGGAPPSRAAPPRHSPKSFESAFDRIRAEHGLPGRNGAPTPAVPGVIPGSAAAGGAGGTPGAPRSSAKDSAAARAAAAAAAGTDGGFDLDEGGGDAGAGDGGDGDGTPLEPLEVLAALELEPEEHDRIAALPEAERDAAIAEAAAARDELLIDLGSRRDGEETVRILAPDKATADLMRARLNQAANREQLDRMREGAEGVLAEAEELRYTAMADPAGFLEENLQHPADRGHVAQFLLTRPGVLDAKIGGQTVREWLQGVLDDPAALQTERRLVEADRVNRKAVVNEDIEVRRFEDRNARGCRRAMISAIDSTAPDDWDDARREELFQDAWRDLRGILRQNNIRTIDPRRMTGIVQSRLSRYGVAPRSSSATPAASKGPGAQKRPATPRTPANLRQTQDARRRAAGAGPGAGSPAAAIPKPPPGTLLTRQKGKDGKVKGSVFDWLRQTLPSMRKAP